MIKFRAWDKENKIMLAVNNICNLFWDSKFIEGYELVPDPKGKREYDLIDHIIDFADAILMQSTGLVDKNDKEIFEDDIVKTTRFFCRADESGGFYEYEKELIGIVKQLEGAWVIDTEKGAIYLWSDIDENEVLGNIWDNLELLEDLE